MIPREEGVSMPEWSPWMAWSELADTCRCSPDQVRDDARDAVARKMIAMETAHGRARFRVTWENWPNLNDYVAPRPTLVEKKKETTKVSSHWFSRRVTVGPGESYDFTVPDLPADFTLQKISFRNTGESESVTIAGGGPAENGILVLETEAEKAKSLKSDISTKKTTEKRESTPQKNLPERESTPQKLVLSPPLVDACARFGLVADDAIIGMVVACQNAAKDCTIEEITQQVLLIGGNAAKNRSTVNPAGVVKTQVPKYFASTRYQTTPKEPVKAEADRCEVHGYPMPCSVCWRERRAARQVS